MITITGLIREVEDAGSSLSIEGEQLKVCKGKLLPPMMFANVKTHKAAIIEVISRDQKAREAGFNVLCSGEVYERQIGVASHVFVMKESDNSFSSFRVTWRPGFSVSISQKQLSESVSFDLALLKAAQYVAYSNRRTKT